MTRQAAPGAPTGATVEFQVHFRPGDRGRRRLRRGARPLPAAVARGRIPRISRLMALAIHFDGLIRKGVVRDYADLARLGGVSKSRISQIMDLLNLAPKIQEAMLFPAGSPTCRGALTERGVRCVITEATWHEQIRVWEHRPPLPRKPRPRSRQGRGTRLS